jgi:hypothetical protein
MSRRDWLKTAVGGVGLALGGVIDVPAVKAATRELKLANITDKIARKIRAVRDTTWIATEMVGDAELTVNRTDGFAFMGGAQNTNEECYLFQKATRLLGTVAVESGPALAQRPRRFSTSQRPWQRTVLVRFCTRSE